jgi:uncharacterized RDD family membrane protein YckC
MGEAALKQFAVSEDEAPIVALPAAGHAQRFIAALLDGFISAVLQQLGTVLITRLLHTHHVGVLILWAVIFPVIYYALPIYATGQTAGKKIMKVRVDNAVNPAEGVSFWRAIFRELVGKMVSALCFALGFVAILRDPDGRAWHDRMAKTRVVNVIEE